MGAVPSSERSFIPIYLEDGGRNIDGGCGMVGEWSEMPGREGGESNLVSQLVGQIVGDDVWDEEV